jgi:hypothetical protein
MRESEIEAYRRKVLGPAANAARVMFSSSQGQLVLSTLEEVFSRNIVATDSAGRVDPSATLVRVGEKNVIDYLRGLANNEEDGA